MTATLDQSQAILKVRYPDGALPKLLYTQFKYLSTVNKRTDFTGKYRQISFQNENPQGAAADVATAQGSMQQGSYVECDVPRVSHYAIARIKGEALKAAKGDEGALVDLWTNECDGASRLSMTCTETYVFGNGTGVLGQVSAGSTVGSATITLTTISDIVKFALGMRLQAVTTNTLSPSLRAGTVTITAINRTSGTLTVATTWTGGIPALAASDYLVRAGDYAAAGVGKVITGNQQWFAGGSTPGTLFSLARNADPLRLAGQTYDATGVSMEEAIIEACALVTQQGAKCPGRGWINPRDVANWKKTLQGRAIYDRTNVASKVAGVSFKAIAVEGDDGEQVELLTSPFVPRNEVQLMNPESMFLDSLGPAPMLLDFDDNTFLRVGSDDAYEVRFGIYGNHYTKDPMSGIRVQNFGA